MYGAVTSDGMITLKANRETLDYDRTEQAYLIRDRVKNQVGLAWSDSPDGPWTKSEEPILSPADNGIWKGEKQDRHAVIKKGDFDSHKVHDPCILPFKGKFYLYYKGEQMGEEITFGGRQIRHGVAIADNPRGPYIKSPYNPISNSGHEICVWPYNGGIAALITTDGPEKNTIQWAPDGINFEIMSVLKGVDAYAIGLNRTADNEKEPTEGYDLHTTIISTSIENAFIINQAHQGQYDIINVNHKNDIQNISTDELRQNIVIVLSQGNTDLNPNNIEKIMANFSGRNIQFVSPDNMLEEIKQGIEQYHQQTHQPAGQGAAPQDL